MPRGKAFLHLRRSLAQNRHWHLHYYQRYRPQEYKLQQLSPQEHVWQRLQRPPCQNSRLAFQTSHQSPRLCSTR